MIGFAVAQSGIVSMATRKQKILEDLEELQATCRNGTFPQLERTDFNDDTLIFEVQNVGEFTACLADPYPSGETEVYGPGDFEFRSAGTILDVILGEQCRKPVLDIKITGCWSYYRTTRRYRKYIYIYTYLENQNPNQHKNLR